MAHRARRKQHVDHSPPSASNACGKVAHHSRKDARKAAKWRPGEHLRPYECQICNLWHNGHLTRAIRKGDFTAREIYPPDRA